VKKLIFFPFLRLLLRWTSSFSSSLFFSPLPRHADLRRHGLREHASRDPLAPHRREVIHVNDEAPAGPALDDDVKAQQRQAAEPGEEPRGRRPSDARVERRKRKAALMCFFFSFFCCCCCCCCCCCFRDRPRDRAALQRRRGVEGEPASLVVEPPPPPPPSPRQKLLLLLLLLSPPRRRL
jgi:hypothetical protein